MREMQTRGDLLASQIAFALKGAVRVVRGLWKGLTDEERYAVAEDAVKGLKEHGDPWLLNEDLRLRSAAGPLHSQMQWTPNDKKTRVMFSVEPSRRSRLGNVSRGDASVLAASQHQELQAPSCMVAPR
jgi:hypothetical protein